MKGKRTKFTFPVKNTDFRSWSKNNPKTCVEAAVKPEGVAIRDSKNLNGPVLFFSHAEFSAFTNAVKAGKLDV